MRFLMVMGLLSLAGVAVFFAVRDWTSKRSPEAQRAHSIQELAAAAAKAAAEGNHAEAERLDYALSQVVKGMAPGGQAMPFGGSPLDDYPQYILDAAQRRNQRLMDEAARNVRGRTSPEDGIPEHLRKRAEAARRRAEPKDL